MSDPWPLGAVELDDEMVFIAKSALRKIIDENKKLKERLGNMEHDVSQNGRDFAVDALRKDGVK